MELAVEGTLQQPHFVKIERIVHRHLLVLDRHIEDPPIHPILVQRAAQRLHIRRFAQRLQSLRV